MAARQELSGLAVLGSLTLDGVAVPTTANDIKTLVLSIDGSGSGIDADLLDGKHGSAFALVAGQTFTGTIDAPVVRVGGTDVWHPGNDGSGSGLDADLLDGNHAAAFAKLTGATFTGGVTATGFTGPGWGLTGVNAASLGGQAASAYALLAGAAFTGTVTAPGVTVPPTGSISAGAISAGSGKDRGLMWEDGVNRLTNNDGGGDVHMYWGMRFNSGNVFTHGGGAVQWTANIDGGANTTLNTRVASNPGAGTGEGVTFNLSLDQGADFLRWGGNDIFHAGNLATGSDQRIFGNLGVGGATPDASNAFAFYGTNLLLNSGSDINMKFNKNAAGNDASLTFQSSFTTHALVGLLSNNDLTFKVGTGFKTALVANNATGQVTFPNTVLPARQSYGITGRWYMNTNNRWATFSAIYGVAIENYNQNGGTGAEPDVNWAFTGPFVRAGAVIHEVKGMLRSSSTEVTGIDVRVIFQSGNLASGNWDTNGETTQNLLYSGNNLPFTGTSWAAMGWDCGDFTPTQDGVVLVFIRPVGTITTVRYLYGPLSLEYTLAGS